MFWNKKANTDDKKIAELLTRRIGGFENRPNIWPSFEEAEKKLKEGKRLKIYFGIDPTGPLHLGHTIPLLLLKQLLELGHKPILLIGDFTARIGDPTDKETHRKPLTKKEVKENMKNYLELIYKILPEGSFEVKYNSSWLAKLSLEDFLNFAGKVSAFELMTRNMFRERQKSGNFLGTNEFLYPLMQGYDSVAMNIDGEIGGEDQIFNMLVGRNLEKKMLSKDKLVFATKLLVSTESGKKMSKTQGELISLSDSPRDIFGKTMKTISDEMTALVFRLCTEKPIEWIEQKSKNDPYEFKKELASELVRIYYGEKEAMDAWQEWNRVFSKGELPDDREEVKGGKLVDVVENTINVSATQAKKLIDQGAVRVNGEVVKEWNREVSDSDVQIGPKRFIKIK